MTDSNQGYGHDTVQDRTQEADCRCGMPKEDGVPSLLLCPICDVAVLTMPRAG